MTGQAAPTRRPGSLPRLLSRFGAWALAALLFATSMLVARSFAPAPGTSGPNPTLQRGGGPSAAYEGPDLEGIFVNCSPACDLVVAREGIGVRLTFTDRAVDESAPALSPDGTTVAFRCGEPAVEPGAGESPRSAGLGSICSVSARPVEPPDPSLVPVATLLSAPDTDYGSPAWSRDGRTLAFDFRDAAGEAGIGLLDIAGQRPTRVTDPAIDASKPTWSPDGKRIGFRCGQVAMPAGHNAERFCTMRADGSDVVQLGGVDGSCGAPRYTPDARNLSVVCIVPGAPGGDLFFLSLSEPMSRSVTGTQRIAPEGQRNVAFSPDLAYAFVRREDALWALRLADETWSVPPLPALHGDFDVRVIE
jgi:WD40-like Beta Propeller Repeat